MPFSVLLISPPIFDYYFTKARMEPLGLIYIKQNLEEKMPDVSVEIFDTIEKGKIKNQKRPDFFSYLDDFYQEDLMPFSLFSGYKRLGKSFNAILKKIEEGNYDLIGISSMFSGYYDDVEELVKKIKQKTKIPIVLGGWAVESEGTELFKQSKADYFIKGNGVEGFLNLVEFFNKKREIKSVSGLIYRKNNEIIENKITLEKEATHLNLIPKREFKYYFKGKRIAKTILSTGCVYKCDFCTIHRHQHLNVRSIKSIEKEFEYFLKEGIEVVDFEDDNIFFGKQRNEELIELLTHFHKKGLFYTAMNGMTAKNIEPIAKKIINAGFIEFNMSMVSMFSNSLKNLNRPDFEKQITTILKSTENRVESLVFLILGLPGTTIKTTLKDLIFLAQQPVKIGVSPLYFLPDIPMFQKMGLPKNRRMMRGSALYKFPKEFSKNDIVSLWKFARMINFIKELIDLNQDFSEELFYFKKSIKEKQWYKKTKTGEMLPFLKFNINFSMDFLVKSIKGNTLKVKL